MNDQALKADAGKPKLSLVPTRILYDIAAVRAFGVAKYDGADSWRRVELQRYIDAAWRHWLAFCRDRESVDEESGLPHLWHLERNLAFLTEMMCGGGGRN